MIYLDNNASTQLLPEIRETISDFLKNGNYGNPSSPHSFGRFSREIIEKSRFKIGDLIGTTPYHIIFTSSGSEANNMVLKSLIKNNESVLLTTDVEHSSIIKSCNYLVSLGKKVNRIPVNKNGIINLEKFETLLKLGCNLVSIQWVNNETGVIQPIEEIIRIAHSYGVLVHTDGAQALGKIPIDIENLDVDFFTATGHKMHALQGIGFVYAKNINLLMNLIHSGYEEFELRGGTENTLGILSLGKASELRLKSFISIDSKMINMRNSFEKSICNNCPEIKINGKIDSRVSNTSNLLFPEIDGQAMIAQLNLAGIICSQTSACSSQIPEPSHVLTAMGLSVKNAFSSLRFSFSELNTQDELHIATEKICKVYKKLISFKNFY